MFYCKVFNLSNPLPDMTDRRHLNSLSITQRFFSHKHFFLFSRIFSSFSSLITLEVKYLFLGKMSYTEGAELILMKKYWNVNMRSIEHIKTFISCNSLDSLPVNRGQLANSCLYSSKGCDSEIPSFSQCPVVACHEQKYTFTCLDDTQMF